MPLGLVYWHMDYQDLAIIIAWPDQTARGDEAWMAFFKKLGIVKNLNFKVGHAAIVLVEKSTGHCAYYDFGRYITPRGYGRARSAILDPRLQLTTRLKWDQQNQLINLEELLTEMDQKAYATHGGGRMFFSLSDQFNFKKGSQFAQQLVDVGPILYGALAPNNNSCSRYVAQILLAGWPSKDGRRGHLIRPESLKPSPMSNVVNGVRHRQIFCWYEGRLTSQKLNRWHSLRFQMAQLSINLSRKQSADLPPDTTNGQMDIPQKPFGIPLASTWLGGLGEGAWFHFDKLPSHGSLYQLSRYDAEGQLEYQQQFNVEKGTFVLDEPWEWTFIIGFRKLILKQKEKEIVFIAENKPLYQTDTQTLLHTSTKWN